MADSPSSFVALQRSFSMTNLDEATELRELVEADLKEPPDKSKHVYFPNLPKYTFVLATFQNSIPDYRQFLCANLLDEEMLKELENTKCLNWSASLLPLVPIPTSGDGNCLLHAALISLLAVHDRRHTLRKAIHRVLSEDYQGNFRIRWQGEQEVMRCREGITYMEEDWDQEWNNIIRLVSEEENPNGRDGLQYGSSEEIHIFALANVLRRTVIIVCDDVLRGWYGENLSTVPFGGIYLPLNWDPIDCVKTPLVLGYSHSHFTALVPVSGGDLDLPGRTGVQINPYAIHAVPLVKHNGLPLKVHFLRGTYERQNQDGLLRQYLDCSKIPKHSGSNEEILVARCAFVNMLENVNKMVEGYYSVLSNKYHKQKQEKEQLQASHYTASQPDQRVPCTTPGCNNIASLSTGSKCGSCVAKFLREATSSQESNPPYNPHYPSHCQQPTAQNVAQPMDTSPAPIVSPQSHATTPSTVPPRTVSEIKPPMLQSSPKCPTQGCKYYVYTATDRFCQRCKESEMENMPVPCANFGCKFSGCKKHYNLCSKCFDEFRNSLSVVPYLAPPHNLCHHQGCQSEGCPDLVGRCPSCYMEAIKNFIHPTRGNVAQADVSYCCMEGCVNQKSAEFGDFCLPCYEKLRRRSLPAVDVSQVNSPSPTSPAAVPSRPLLRVEIPHHPTANIGTASPVSAAPLCSTPNCQNLRGQALGTLCSECYQVRSNPDKNVLLFNINSSTPITILSGNGAPTTIQCNIKGCTQLGDATHSNLCLEHYTSIINSQSNPVAPETQQELQANDHCAKPNCTFYAGPATNYLCSRHFSQTQEEPFHAYPPLSQIIPEEVSCAIEGCYNRAREELNNLCLNCYENGVKMEIEHHHVPASQTQQGNAQTTANTAAQQARSRTPSPRVLLPCKTSGCPNLVDPSVHSTELCTRCSNGNSDVIRRGNRPSDPVYRPPEPRPSAPRPNGPILSAPIQGPPEPRPSAPIQGPAEHIQRPVVPPHRPAEPLFRPSGPIHRPAGFIQQRDHQASVEFPVQVPPPHVQAELNVCQRPGCHQYVGSTNTFCAVCLNSPPEPSANHLPERPKCVVSACQNLGVPHCFNYCPSCFQQYHPDHTQQGDVGRQFNKLTLQ